MNKFKKQFEGHPKTILLTALALLILFFTISGIGNNFINWSDNHQGFLMVVLTLIYVIATILILSATNKSTKIARESLDLAKHQMFIQQSPKINFALKADNATLNLNIKNEGNSTAVLNLHINEIESIMDYYSDKFISVAPNNEFRKTAAEYIKSKYIFFTKTPITLMPKQTIAFETALENDDEFSKIIKQMTVSCSFQYNGSTINTDPVIFNLVMYEQLILNSPETDAELTQAINNLSDVIANKSLTHSW